MLGELAVLDVQVLEPCNIHFNIVDHPEAAQHRTAKEERNLPVHNRCPGQKASTANCNLDRSRKGSPEKLGSTEPEIILLVDEPAHLLRGLPPGSRSTSSGQLPICYMRCR